MSEYRAWVDRVVDHLNDLIQLDYDAAQTYRLALDHVDDPAVHIDFEMFLADHERHIMELTTLVRELGGEPIALHRDLRGALLEGMTRLRSWKGTVGALRAMRMNERLTHRSYDRILDVPMPPLAQALALENVADERRHLAAIEGHLERLTGKPARQPDRASAQPEL